MIRQQPSYGLACEIGVSNGVVVLQNSRFIGTIIISVRKTQRVKTMMKTMAVSPLVKKQSDFQMVAQTSRNEMRILFHGRDT